MVAEIIYHSDFTAIVPIIPYQDSIEDAYDSMVDSGFHNMKIGCYGGYDNSIIIDR